MNITNKGSSPTRVVKPLYASTGDSLQDKLAFFHILEELKTQKRTGWVNHKIPNPESISDHMYRMAVLAMCSEDPNLDIAKCVMLAVVHDLAEAQVGDITPDEGFTDAQKRQLEENAMKNFVNEMLHGSPIAAQRIFSLWQEYEERKTPEARFVKDLDRLEMALQAREYERRHAEGSSNAVADLNLQQFFDSSIPKIENAEVKSWGAALASSRGLNP
ncbi:hypothetical protein M408DRAFT_190844 [Serendipita vermifera MAFF 305830]|uniref:5'-deoxynucleotidase n=1 Tax=Serendipita vermifera MAFF 305830 TaxID=933852 RepID=A0A0C3BNI6_SERVB|nr:hypothetical protein M408DRAFT_190844 [Serendipita vermifera MAFF 305830]